MIMNVLEILAVCLKTAATLMDHTAAPALMDTREMLLAVVVISTNALPEATLALLLSRPVSTTLVLSAAHALLDTRETLTELA